MEIVKKFVLNTQDFQVYFDNDKKTYVAMNLETGEKTNVGVLGTFLQMGILKPFDEVEKKDAVLQRLDVLENKVNKLMQSVDGLNSINSDQLDEPEEEIQESTEERKLKSEVAEKIMEKTLKNLSKKEENISDDSDEEMKNWLDV